MNSTAPIGQKQTGRLGQGRMANTMPADMKGGKRAPTATTSKAIGKNYHLNNPLFGQVLTRSWLIWSLRMSSFTTCWNCTAQYRRLRLRTPKTPLPFQVWRISLLISEITSLEFRRCKARLLRQLRKKRRRNRKNKRSDSHRNHYVNTRFIFLPIIILSSLFNRL